MALAKALIGAQVCISPKRAKWLLRASRMGGSKKGGGNEVITRVFVLVVFGVSLSSWYSITSKSAGGVDGREMDNAIVSSRDLDVSKPCVMNVSSLSRFRNASERAGMLDDESKKKSLGGDEEGQRSRFYRQPQQLM